jgi:cellulose synthase/poly-beta-1,6-N-acetylglucosamine synthase-like glycosyltransferase
LDLFPIQLLFLLVITNRYVAGPLLRRALGASFDATVDGWEPTVSFVIPLFNEGRGIVDTIRSLLRQDYPSDKLSVVVVDDCSTDDSYEWASRAAAEHPAAVTVLRAPRNQGKRAGINMAVARTKAEIIVSVDSDVVVDRGAVRQLVRRFATPRIAAVGGRTYVANRNVNLLTRMIEVKFHFSQEWLKDLERACRSVVCLTGCLSAYRRHVLVELEPILATRNIAGVPIKYGEDRFLTQQVLKAGYQTAFTADAFCFTAAPTTLGGYFSQQLRWRRSNLVDFLGWASQPWRIHPVVAVHYLTVLGLLLAYPVVVIDNLVEGQLWMVMVLHIGFVALLGFIYRIETRRLPEGRRVSALAFLPMAVVMPVSYLVITPLALFTLDSSSWETRGGAAAGSSQGAAARAA